MLDAGNIENLGKVLKFFDFETARFMKEYESNPLPSSKAMVEHASLSNPESIATTCYLGVQLIELGADHLSAFVKLIAEPVETIAAWTTVRSMLESCSVSAWLLDPDIDVTTRIGRSFALRYEGMLSELKLMRVMKKPQGDIDTMNRRIDSVEGEAVPLGYSEVKNKKGDRIGIGCQMPSATDMISAVLDQGKIYCIASAITHAHTYAIRGVTYQAIDGPDGKFGPVDVKAFRKIVNVEGLMWLGVCAAMAYARPL